MSLAQSCKRVRRIHAIPLPEKSSHMPCCISGSLGGVGASAPMEGACLRLGFGLETSTGLLSPPTPEIRSRSLKDRLAPPCSTQQLSFQWFRHANRPFIPCRVKFFHLFLDSDSNHVVIYYLVFCSHARLVSRPLCPRDFLASIPHRPLTLLRALRLNSAYRFSSPKFVVGTSSLLRLFCFHALTNCKFHNPFLFTTIQNAGGVSHSHSLVIALFPVRASCSSCLTLSSSADTINSSPTGRDRCWQFPRRIPMKLAYFDCFSGISGDMTLGALVDAGCSVDHLRAELRGLQVPGWELSAEKVWKNGMAATYVKVRTEEQSKHRSLGAILEILQKSQLAAQVRERAAAIFTKLGEAEARVHDVRS